MNVIWTKETYNAFLSDVKLTKDERNNFDCIVSGMSMDERAEELKVSLSTIKRLTKSLKMKYDLVQKSDPRLPLRAKTKKELVKYLQEKYPSKE